MQSERVDFPSAAQKALADQRLRSNLRRAMDGLMEKRAAQFVDVDRWNALRARGENARQRALSKLPELLVQLEEKLIANGIQVHWAQTTDEANSIIVELLKGAKAKSVVKGKSMVSEEMHLNGALERDGIEVVESDLGEYVIQLAGEGPSHIIMPCIHKERDEIGKLFQEKIPGAPYSEEPEELTAMARTVLREKFAQADAGISGVNMAVAETGTLVLVENEGNGRMSTTVPDMHIAVTGIDKVVEKLEDVPPLLSLLTRSATGQPITTYVNMISSPRKEGELDGPREVHLVLLDNGRSGIYEDPERRATLQCIRCGACMNHCPVYGRIGGHAYQGVYPGPIGKILTPQLQGLDEYPDHAGASTLCQRCAEVCPVAIPIGKMLVNLRAQKAKCGEVPIQGCGGGSTSESVGWNLWFWLHASPWRYRVMARLAASFRWAIPSWLPGLRVWSRVRVPPKPAQKPLHQRLHEIGVDHE
ncbi:LutB/LldF family L-lactate oxidation iron-sulfur protein [Magnetococcus sp. PR-3]|uniref:LutB/LldF family L-lactate oxidation iron-sulfur protein n=1 Tax=Magnetococcus sp. PR-3 TaxID=3120355 RepID=UPI002FCE4314